MKKKCLVIGIILLFVGVNIVPTINFGTVKAQDAEKSQSLLRGDWLYVGGSGSGNYTRIQDAIDNAFNGDTIYVYHKTYREHLIITKSITLLGEDKKTTTLNGFLGGHYPDYQVKIIADNVEVNGFTIMNSNQGGIYASGRNLIIKNNIITDDNMYGIYFHDSQSCLTQYNSITQDLEYGIFLSYCRDMKIQFNNLSNWAYGIYFFDFCKNIYINKNQISHIHYTPPVHNNLFITYNNIESVSFFRALIRTLSNDHSFGIIHFDSNYWGSPQSPPKVIEGTFGIFDIPIYRFDWHPAQEPYDIRGMS
jgi:parallel beta-helix repeat protein